MSALPSVVAKARFLALGEGVGGGVDAGVRGDAVVVFSCQNAGFQWREDCET